VRLASSAEKMSRVRRRKSATVVVRTWLQSAAQCSRWLTLRLEKRQITTARSVRSRVETECDAHVCLNEGSLRRFSVDPAVHEVCTNGSFSNALGLAFERKQVPRFVVNVGSKGCPRNRWKGVSSFASRGSPVRSRSRPPPFFLTELAAVAAPFRPSRSNLLQTNCTVRII